MQLTISARDLEERIAFVAVVDSAVEGFYSLRPSARSWELDNLWVLPRAMHRGIGRALLMHALSTAARGGATEVTVDADRHAEAFYLSCGAVRRGEVAAPIAGEPRRARPQLAFCRLDSGVQQIAPQRLYPS